jgi:catechol 2,3-dioxygenase-like lactoylglutathione lyase family enzyme
VRIRLLSTLSARVSTLVRGDGPPAWTKATNDQRQEGELVAALAGQYAAPATGDLPQPLEDRGMTLGTATPIFRIFDEAKARQFYVDFLGFAIVFEHRAADNMPLYMAIARDGCELHLTEHHGDCCPGAAVRIDVSDVDALCQGLNAQRYPFGRPSVEEMPWGSRDLSVRDPFGNQLTFTQSLPDPAPMQGVTIHGSPSEPPR